jgi:DNA-directed RNA polymerase subunit K/omega
VVNRDDLANAFEFVVVAGLRARQLQRGALPRVARDAKVMITAQREVFCGVVLRLDPEPPPTPPRWR